MARRKKSKLIRDLLLFAVFCMAIAFIAVIRDIYSYAGWIAVTAAFTGAGFFGGWRARHARITACMRNRTVNREVK